MCRRVKYKQQQRDNRIARDFEERFRECTRNKNDFGITDKTPQPTLDRDNKITAVIRASGRTV